MTTGTSERENRVFVLMPTGRDAELVCSMLDREGISSQECNTYKKLASAVSFGAGAILLVEEALNDEASVALLTALDAQPVWSDIPVIVFSSSSRNAETILQTLGERINATVVERPIRITMLVSAVKAALRARQRQYQTRDLLQELEQSDKQKDLFLATLSHELRTPLNSILGWIQLLRTNSSNLSSTEHALDVIERNAKAQSEIISDILFVSRIVTGKLELKPEPLDLENVVRAAADVIRPSVEAKHQDLVLGIETVSTRINGDSDRLQQVFLNLFSNAVKFTNEGGRIEVTIAREGPNVVVTVSDTGRGIEEEFLPYVFERFRQADNTYTRRVGGLGLGLAIVRHLVELHGGEVKASSEGKDRGATFIVHLPLWDPVGTSAPEKAEGTTNGKRMRVGGLSGLRLMLVEDDQDSREMLSTFLEAQGIDVMAVDSAARALEKLPLSRPDIVISDIGLPGLDGYDLIREIRSLAFEEGGGTPAIALTGFVSVQDRKQALRSGFQEHLAKPIDVDELLKLISRLAPKSLRAQT